MNRPPPQWPPPVDGLHRLAVDHHPRIVVAEPAPGVRGADRVHDLFLEHLRQRLAPEVERGERQHVHARVVVLVDRAGLVAWPRLPLVELVGRPVGPVGLAPERALPVAGLPQQVVPGDGAVVRRVEQVDQVRLPHPVGAIARGQGIVELDRRDVFAGGVVDAADHAAVERHADHARQQALGDAVGHVDARRLAPFGDDDALVDDDAGLVAAVLDRSDRLAERLAAERPVVIELEVARVLHFARDGEIDRVLEQLRIDAGFRGRSCAASRRRETSALALRTEAPALHRPEWTSIQCACPLPSFHFPNDSMAQVPA